MSAGIVYLLALACVLLLALGYAVVGLLSLWPRTRAATAEVWPVLVTETLIVGVVVGTFIVGGWVLVLGFLLHAFRTAFEAARITLPRAGFRGPWPAVLAGLALVVLGGLAAFVHPVPLALLCLLALLVCYLAWRFAPLPDRVRPGLELALFPGVPLVLFTALALQGFAATLLIAFLLVETFDSYALLGGKLFGRTKAFPVLSPRKTVEGLAVGAAMLALTAGAVGVLLLDLPLVASVGAGLFAGLFSIAGDLSASRLKRAAGVKDFPRVLQYQGGLLDITDAWIATGAGLLTLSLLS